MGLKHLLSPSVAPHSSSAQETRYRALSKEEQLQKRKALYDALCPIAQHSEAKIPYLKDYRGLDIYLSRQKDVLIMQAKASYDCNPYVWTIQLASDGQYHSCFSDGNSDSRTSITIENGTTIQLNDSNARFGKKDVLIKGEVDAIEFLNPNKTVQYTKLVQDFVDHDNGLMELLIFKQEQIVTSFEEKEWNVRLKSLQDNILSLFTQIRNSTNSPPSSTALAAPFAFPIFKSNSLGPIWSPVAASQDSTFKWTIERDDQENIYLIFEKYSNNRGKMQGTSSRTMRFQQNAKGELLVDFLKTHTYDIGKSFSEVSYQLQFKDNHLLFIPLNDQSQSFCCWGGDIFKSAANNLPASDRMKADFELIISSLITVSDIIRSPESLIFDPEKNQAAVLFTGNRISQEQADQLLAFSQGNGCLGAMPFYEAKSLCPTVLTNSIEG